MPYHSTWWLQIWRGIYNWINPLRRKTWRIKYIILIFTPVSKTHITILLCLGVPCREELHGGLGFIVDLLRFCNTLQNKGFIVQNKGFIVHRLVAWGVTYVLLQVFPRLYEGENGCRQVEGLSICRVGVVKRSQKR